MWLLHFLPDSFLTFAVNATLILGIISVLVSFFVLKPLSKWLPVLSKYATAIQILSVLILVAGVYFKGGYSTEMQWRDRVKELEEKLAKAEELSAKVNTKIETKVVTKTKVVKEKGDEIVKYIDREIVKYDNVCVIPKEFIKAHNDAAEAPKK